MNENTAWADLPNAKYIDLVIASLKKNAAIWNSASDTASNTVRNAAREAAWIAAWDAAYGAAWIAAWEAVWIAASDAAYGAAWGAAWDAVRALIAWDDCGYLLGEKPEVVKMIALLGNQAAVLLYPACFALNKSKELENNVTFKIVMPAFN